MCARVCAYIRGTATCGVSTSAMGIFFFFYSLALPASLRQPHNCVVVAVFDFFEKPERNGVRNELKPVDDGTGVSGCEIKNKK